MSVVDTNRDGRWQTSTTSDRVIIINYDDDQDDDDDNEDDDSETGHQDGDHDEVCSISKLYELSCCKTALAMLLLLLLLINFHADQDEVVKFSLLPLPPVVCVCARVCNTRDLQPLRTAESKTWS